MDILVGAEYVIASALITLAQNGADCISFSMLRDLGWNIQQRCNAMGVEAIILTSGIDIKATVYDFPDYFEYENIDEPVIRVKKSAPIEGLKARFMLRLPKNVNDIIRAETSSYLGVA